ncbi:hypothetical protein Salat_2464600 [Sesamum alatum]|uniref:Uncharacterized protein n=1 Tax=Sesamum alatum TaxID=300844 RepID=A0AAE2CBV6_9LAMI|nr:hypothetical protein Salat_2464600 [Sesamum alatum]
MSKTTLPTTERSLSTAFNLLRKTAQSPSIMINCHPRRASSWVASLAAWASAISPHPFLSTLYESQARHAPPSFRATTPIPIAVPLSSNAPSKLSLTQCAGGPCQQSEAGWPGDTLASTFWARK